MQTKEQTREWIQESLAVGFSPKAILEMMEEWDDANLEVLQELRSMI